MHRHSQSLLSFQGLPLNKTLGEPRLVLGLHDHPFLRGADDLLNELDAAEDAHSILDRALAIGPHSDALARIGIPLDERRIGRAAAV